MFDEIIETPYGVKKRLKFICDVINEKIPDLNNKEEMQILDIGCGTGELITIPLGSLGYHIKGIDTHLPSIEYAIKKNVYQNVKFECISLDNLAPSQNDVIICSEVLEHLDDPIIMLKQIKKMLHKDGVCIITIPNGYSLKEIEVRIFNIFITFFIIYLLKPFSIKMVKKIEIDLHTLNDESPHVQFFSRRHFEDLLTQCDLSVMKRENRMFLSGFFINKIFSYSKVLTTWNVSISDKIPYSFASGWMFVLKHKDMNKDEMPKEIQEVI
jgi:2-polyprenyl-3-methyl-5-hydroxy-6-metoxy-1,4-benzoquinol methylase